MTFDMKNSTFTRTGSFRQQTMTERLVDPPSAAVAPQSKSSYNPFAIERPRATPSMLERQGSFRGFTQIGAQSPFKRQMSLRINDLPSNAERQRAFLDANASHRSAVSPIPEVSPQPTDTVSELCKELSQGLSMLSKDTENFLNFEKLANGIIGSGSVNIPSPPSYPTSVVAVAPYRPLMSLQNSSIPIGTAKPIQHSTVTTETSLSITESYPRASSPAVNNSPPSSPPQKIVSIEIATPTPLPKAEQWLTEIVKNASPASKRASPFNTQSRSKSLATSDLFDTQTGVGEWANTSTVSNQSQGPTYHSTNPFISPPKPIQQSFQVQL
jgi:numb-like protein